MKRAAGASSCPPTPGSARHSRGRTGAWHQGRGPGGTRPPCPGGLGHSGGGARARAARRGARGGRRRGRGSAAGTTPAPAASWPGQPRSQSSAPAKGSSSGGGTWWDRPRRPCRDRSPRHGPLRTPPHGWSPDRASCSRNPEPPKAKLRSERLEPADREMVQLSNYLTEALHRELLLKQKMVILQQLLSTLLQASEKSWQGQLNEDKLRCKLRVLENQLQACSQSYSKECVKKILIEMEDQKQTYEQKAKEALQKMLEDKLQTEQQLQNSQRSLAETREDLALWKEQDATLRAELAKVTTAHTELKNSFQALQSELQRADAQSERLRRELRELRSERSELLHTASALRSDSHTRATLLQHLQDKLQKEQEQKVTLEATVSHLQNLIHNQNNQGKSQEVTVQRKGQVFITQTPPLTPAKEKQNALLEHPEEEEEGTESLKDEMKKKASQLTAKENEEHQDTQAEEPGRAPLRVKLCSRCSSPASRGVHRAEGTPPAPSPGLCSRRSELRSELEALSEQYRSCLTQLRQCREQLNRGSRAQSGPWIPLLVAVAAVAIATFLASYRL
ncbi:PREDICTED: TRAF3-interacting JNK-activating modulator isoform X2 [Pseudopodoces humilis]|uniref:TRAF3-interacting JNK-activating modulator isoform X2 n=1 Tax=Pseudopodoces humilis TaxID=181119 RepID=UPI0006B739F0|nr:PREDICTED: TRAF3-interacting JNK-activating modulator isoform X2 [Pseudopodoces humilis]